MKRIIIADIISKYDADNGHPFGHYLNLSEQYYRALSSNYEVLVACSREFKRYIPDDIQTLDLRYSTKYRYGTGRVARWINIIKQQLNLIKVLFKKADLIILQSPDSLLQLLPLAVYFGSKKVVVVFYRNLLEKQSKAGRVLKRLLFSFCKRKIAGTITGIDEVGLEYGLEYLVMPDYIEMEERPKKNTQGVEYDLAVLGINSRSKNLVDIVKSFQNTRYQIIIAGRFVDNSQLKEIRSIASTNVTIIDEYLDNKTYMDILNKSRFVGLPYDPSIYKLQSSGVFYEAVYSGTPIICSNTSFLEIVRKKELGFVYEKSISESASILDNNELYETYRKNIASFVSALRSESIRRLNEFIERLLLDP